MTTLTTVGTFTPETPLGRLVTVIAILVGLTVVPLQLSDLARSATSALDIDAAESGVAAAPPLASRAGRSADVGVCATCDASEHRADAAFCYACGAPLTSGATCPDEAAAAAMPADDTPSRREP